MRFLSISEHPPTRETLDWLSPFKIWIAAIRGGILGSSAQIAPFSNSLGNWTDIKNKKKSRSLAHVASLNSQFCQYTSASNDSFVFFYPLFSSLVKEKKMTNALRLVASYITAEAGPTCRR